MPRKLQRLTVAELHVARTEPIPSGGLNAHVIAKRDRISFFRSLVRAGEAGHVVAGTSALKETQLLQHLARAGLIRVEDTPEGKVRLAITPQGQAHPELAALIREARLLDQLQAKVREDRAARRAPLMPLAEARRILGEVPQIKRAIGDLWTNRGTSGHMRVLDMNIYRPYAQALKALEAEGVLTIRGAGFHTTQVFLSLTEAGKSSPIISMLAV